MRNKTICFFLTWVLLLCGCSSTSYPSEYPTSPSATLSDLKLPKADGEVTFSDGTYIMVDASHVEAGYLMVRQLAESEKHLKIMIEKDDQSYHYDVDNKEDVAIPLQMGDGTYEIRLLQQTQGEQYVRLLTEHIEVQLTDSFSPYLYPSKIVNYSKDSKAIEMAFKLVEHDTTDLQRIMHLYEFVTTNIDYDDAKAEAVKNKFVLPEIDTTLATKKGICFDYAALLAAMLRSQNIPTRLVTGYTDIEYHAWVEIYIEKEGWINPKTFFEKSEWSRMDPTFAASDMDYEGAYEQVYVY